MCGVEYSTEVRKAADIFLWFLPATYLTQPQHARSLSSHSAEGLGRRALGVADLMPDSIMSDGNSEAEFVP